MQVCWTIGNGTERYNQTCSTLPLNTPGRAVPIKLGLGDMSWVRDEEVQIDIAAICHAPWLLIEAGVVRGKTLASFPSLATDINNAGGQWVDEQVHQEGGLITSRNPDDLNAFCDAVIATLAGHPRG